MTGNEKDLRVGSMTEANTNNDDDSDVGDCSDSDVDGDNDRDYSPQSATVQDEDEHILLESKEETPRKKKEFNVSCPDFLAMVVDEAHTFTGPAERKHIFSFRERTQFLYAIFFCVN